VTGPASIPPSPSAFTVVPRSITVFDSNIYRTLGVTRALALAPHERAHGVIAVATVYSVMELGAHLADPADTSYRACWSGMRALWQHCKEYDGAREVLRVVADADAQLARTLFDRPVAGRQEQAALYGALVGHLARSTTEEEIERVRPTLISLREHRDRVEAQFVSDMQRVVMALDPASNPTQPGWRPLRDNPERRRELLSRIDAGDGLPIMAETFVRRTADTLDLVIDDSEVADRAKFLLQVLTPPLHFYNALVRTLVADGLDLSKPNRVNGIWDMHIAFYASPGGLSGGLPVHLVTDDKAILQAALRSGANSSVSSSTDYFTSLGMTPA
jgi:hypothetical protein